MTKNLENMAFKTNDFLPADNPVRVVAYGRIGINNSNQLSSIELQTEYYKKFIEEQSKWIYSENESFHTMQFQAEIMLTLLKVMAEVESENKGKNTGCVFPNVSPFD